jgi:outer membrane protein TolC
MVQALILEVTLPRDGESSTKDSPNPNSNEFNLPFDVSWEPDGRGRVRNTVQEYANAARVSAADLANELLTEQANLAVYYSEWCGQEWLIDLYRRSIEAYRESLRRTKVLRATGIDDDQAIAQAELNLRVAEATATNLGIACAV